MPEISRFYGIIIRMYYDDHNPPHFDALYGDDEAWVNINTLAIFSGSLPSRALGMVIEWASMHQDELRSVIFSASRRRLAVTVLPSVTGRPSLGHFQIPLYFPIRDVGAGFVHIRPFGAGKGLVGDRAKRLLEHFIGRQFAQRLG